VRGEGDPMSSGRILQAGPPTTPTRPRLTREKLYMLAGAKARVAAAEALLREAAGNVQIAAGDDATATAKVRSAVIATESAMHALFKRLKGGDRRMNKPTHWSDTTPTPIADILQAGAEAMLRPPQPPISTDDALRQIATTGSDDAKRLARAELRRRGKR
jgi:hypothetical protein